MLVGPVDKERATAQKTLMAALGRNGVRAIVWCRLFSWRGDPVQAIAVALRPEVADMVDVDDYLAFIAVAERGSLTAAALHLGRSLQSVSRSLGALEADLDQTLVKRTTRTIHVSDAGFAFLARIKPALAELAAAHVEAGIFEGRVAGPLTISTASVFGTSFVGSAAVSFMDRHGGVDVAVDLTDDVVDLVGDGVDLAVRLGDLPDSGLMSKRIGTLRRVAFASPRYLANAGPLEKPLDLVDHQCIVRDAKRRHQTWSFERDGTDHAVSVGGRLRSNSSAVCLEGALRGAGIALAQFWQVSPMLGDGRAVIVLPDYSIAGIPIHVVWTRQRFMPLRLRLFIDHLAESIITFAT